MTVESPIVVTQSNEQEAVAGAQLNLDVADEEKEMKPQDDEADLASSPRLTSPSRRTNLDLALRARRRRSGS